MVAEVGHLLRDEVHVIPGLCACGLRELLEVFQLVAIHPMTTRHRVAVHDEAFGDIELEGVAESPRLRRDDAGVGFRGGFPFHPFKADGEFGQHAVEFAFIKPDAVALRTDLDMEATLALVEFRHQFLTIARTFHAREIHATATRCNCQRAGDRSEGLESGLAPAEDGRTMSCFEVDPMLRSWVEIDPAAFAHNLAVVRDVIGPDCGVLAVVKADAYGHGATAAARALAPGTAIFGVANLAEAACIEAAGTGRDVMLLSPCLPAERAEAVRRGVIVTVSGADEAKAFGRGARLNFKIDTGMGRAGAEPKEALNELAEVVAAGLEVHSVSTHLPVSDEDAPFTTAQLETFAALADAARRIAPGAKIHSLNSAGVFGFRSHAADIVRVGLALYGSSPLAEFQRTLRPVLAWKARFTLVRTLPAGRGVSYGRTFVTPAPMRTGLLPVGYADGFPRSVSGRGACVLAGGVRCPVLGRVTMDQIVVDLEAAPDVSEGDEAVLIGSQGGECLPVGELAARAGTIAWDILTGIKARVARVYP